MGTSAMFSHWKFFLGALNRLDFEVGGLLLGSTHEESRGSVEYLAESHRVANRHVSVYAHCCDCEYAGANGNSCNKPKQI
jgi:hypothetical protein